MTSPDPAFGRYSAGDPDGRGLYWRPADTGADPEQVGLVLEPGLMRELLEMQETIVGLREANARLNRVPALALVLTRQQGGGAAEGLVVNALRAAYHRAGLIADVQGWRLEADVLTGSATPAEDVPAADERPAVPTVAELREQAAKIRATPPPEGLGFLRGALLGVQEFTASMLERTATLKEEADRRG